MSDDQGSHLPEFDVTDGPLTFQCVTYPDDHPDLTYLGVWAHGHRVPDDRVMYYGPKDILYVRTSDGNDGNTTWRGFTLSRRPKDGEKAADLVTELGSSLVHPENLPLDYHRSVWVVGFQSEPTDSDDREGIAACLQDGRLLETYGDHWWMLGITCQVFMDNTCITESKYDYARWGIPSDSGESEFREIFRELRAEAEHALPDVLERLEEDAYDASIRVTMLKGYLKGKAS